MKELGKAFSTLGENLASLQEGSDLSDSEEEQSRFLFSRELAGVVEAQPATNHVSLVHTVIQGLQQCLTLATKVRKKFHGLDLSLCVALDNQSSCDIFNNKEFCCDIRKAPTLSKSAALEAA